MANEVTTGNGGPKGQMVQVPRAGQVASQGFGASSLEVKAETATAALVAQAKASVEARCIMARQFPRDIMVTRDRLLNDCQRPAFAEAAIYHKPVGKGIEGPSIRLAEAAARALGNIHSESIVIYDDNYKRMVKITAVDLETNVTFDGTVVVEKTVERRELKKGQTAVNQRVNSYGDPVFVVLATDDDVLNKVNAVVSKTLRTLLLRLVPGDLLDEALQQCRATMANKDSQDPAAAKKKMCDAFNTLGVSAQQLSTYLGHPISDTSVDELSEMRALYATIHEGETSWQAALDHKLEQRKNADAYADEKSPAPAADGTDKGKMSLADVAAKAKAAREKKTGKADAVEAQAEAPAVDSLEPGSNG